MSRWSALDLACRRGERLLFRGLSFELPPGRLAWVRGPNGSGKTSLLRLLAGLAPPEAGELHLGGQPLLPRAPRPACFIAHANALNADLTATEALAFLLRLQGHRPDADELARALAAWGLARHQHAPVRTLSQGQRRRVTLARLALRPAADASMLWLLDEPFEALDTEGVALAHRAIAAHLAHGGGVMLSAHGGLDLAQLSGSDSAAAAAIQISLEPAS
jgi:heme exporter protein A